MCLNEYNVVLDLNNFYVFIYLIICYILIN